MEKYRVRLIITCTEKKGGSYIPSRLAGEPFRGGFLLWNDGTLLTLIPDSPFAAEKESGFCLVSLVLATSESVCLSWRLVCLGISACLGGGSLGTSGAPLTDLLRFRGTTLAETSPSLMEVSFWPSVAKKRDLQLCNFTPQFNMNVFLWGSPDANIKKRLLRSIDLR